jgi:myo-inositol-hexaphosphate 3-phosphohydrolase
MLPSKQHPEAIRRYIASLGGQKISLRLATERDAEFILSLRLNPERNAHISKTAPSVLEQLKWMANYESRFEDGKEAYFIITDHGADVGTVRIYDYLTSDSFCWGSWIIKPGTPELAAFSTPVLIYDLGFHCLDFEAAHFDIRKENVSVWKFEEMMGAELICIDELSRRYTYPRSKYNLARARLVKLIGLNT